MSDWLSEHAWAVWLSLAFLLAVAVWSSGGRENAA